MRIIIFRGIREDNGEWAYGSLVRNENRYIIVQDNTDFGSDYFHHLTCSLSFDVKKETVGQYTGLKDKNGGLIWEGDLYFGSCGKTIYQVFFKSGAFVGGRQDGACMPLGWKPDSYEDECIEDPTDWFEIIGNIHQNEDLLTHK